MGKPAVAPVLMDGVVIGYVTAGSAEDVSPNPLGSGSALGSPAPHPSAFPQGTSIPHQRRLGSSHGPSGGSHHATHHRYLDPKKRADQASRERAAQEKHGPTFRPGVTPRGTAETTKPEHLTLSEVNKAVAGHEPEKPKTFSTSDVQSAVKGGSGLKGSRERFRQELQNKPWLREKIIHISHGENENPTANRAVIESAMNRASMMGTSLEQEMRRTNEGGYYAGYRENVGDRGRAMINENIEAALSGSNVSNFATDNSSQGFHVSGPNPLYRRTGPNINDESFSVPNRAGARGYDRYNAWRQGVEGGGQPTGVESPQRNLPKGVTRLPAGEIPKAESTFARLPGHSTGAMNAATGQPPAAFIMHHTGGGRTPEDIQNTLRQRGLGVEYIMDREGNIIRAGGPGSSHMLTGWGPKGSGLSNQNTVGMEVIAKDNKDVTSKQVESAQRFIRENYSSTPVYGHGEVNPGHKEADEGMAIVNAIRNERANSDKK